MASQGYGPQHGVFDITVSAAAAGLTQEEFPRVTRWEELITDVYSAMDVLEKLYDVYTESDNFPVDYHRMVTTSIHVYNTVTDLPPSVCFRMNRLRARARARADTLGEYDEFQDALSRVRRLACFGEDTSSFMGKLGNKRQPTSIDSWALNPRVAFTNEQYFNGYLMKFITYLLQISKHDFMVAKTNEDFRLMLNLINESINNGQAKEYFLNTLFQNLRKQQDNNFNVKLTPFFLTAIDAADLSADIYITQATMNEIVGVLIADTEIQRAVFLYVQRYAEKQGRVPNV